MLEKKYYEVSIVNDNWQKIHDEICSQTCNCEHIPDEKIECYDPMYYSPTRSRYLLTEEEAEKLKNHPDIDYVELDVTFYPELRLIATPSGSFVKREFDSTSQQSPKIYRNVTSVVPDTPTIEENKRNNWGIKRCEESINEYFSNSGFEDTSTTSIDKISNRAGKALQFTAYNFPDPTVTNVSYGYVGYTSPTEKITRKKLKNFTKESDISQPINDAIISKYYTSSLNSINYEKSGKNVDVMILDDGMYQYHPEYKDRFPTSASESFSGKSRARDLILDGPYFLDPEYFDQNTAYKAAKFDGRPTCTRDGAINWWKNTNNSSRSARFSTIAKFPYIDISIIAYYEENVIGGPPAPGHEIPSTETTVPRNITGTKDHGNGSTGVACGKNFGTAVDSRIWNVSAQLGGVQSYVIFPTSFDLITAFHEAKKLCPDSVVRYSGGDSSNKLNSAPTICNNSYGISLDLFSPIIRNTFESIHNNWTSSSSTGPMDGYSLDLVKSVGGSNGVYNVKIIQKLNASIKQTTMIISGVDNILISAQLRSGNSFSTITPIRSSGIEKTAGEELITSGAIFVASAMNDQSHVVSYTDSNYDNFIQTFTFDPNNEELNGNNITYRNSRGFPNDLGGVDSQGYAKTINVGASDNNVLIYSDGSPKELVADFTNRGSGIDIFAPGQEVLSCGNNFFRYDAAGGKISEFTQSQADKYGHMKDRLFNGTSCAGPITVGVIALYLEEKPNATYQDVQNWLKSTGSVKADFYNEFSNPNDPKYWESLYSLLDSPDRMLHNPYVTKVYSFTPKNSTFTTAANNTPEPVFANEGLTKTQSVNLITSPPKTNSPEYAAFKLAVNTVDLYLNSPQASPAPVPINPVPADGGNGGIGLRVYNIGAKNLVVSVKSGALVAGGGGGGGAGTKGGTGGQGGDGLADGGTTTVYDSQGSCNAFRACYNICFGGSGYVCTGQEATVSQNCNINYINLGCTAIPNSNNHGVPRNVDNPDTPTTGGIGGPGGNGANGGNGEGYDGTESEGVGVVAVTDWAGKTGGANAGDGGKGGNGGNGGEGGTYGSNGSPGIQGDTGNRGADGNVTGGSAGLAGDLPVGNGGTAGKAIDGLNYILNPSPPPSGTIKGNI